MLGFILTSVFFFLAMRQRSTIQNQRDTAAILNAKAYLNSYANYLEDLTIASLTEITEYGSKKINFDNSITGKVTNKPTEIVGMVDFGKDKKATYKFGGDVYIEWNKCAEEFTNYRSDIYINNTLYKHKKEGGGCTNDKNYNDVVLVTIKDTLTIKTLNAPAYYRITAKDEKTTLVDNKWHMDLKIDLDYGKKVTINKTFTPKPVQQPPQN